MSGTLASCRGGGRHASKACSLDRLPAPWQQLPALCLLGGLLFCWRGYGTSAFGLTSTGLAFNFFQCRHGFYLFTMRSDPGLKRNVLTLRVAAGPQNSRRLVPLLSWRLHKSPRNSCTVPRLDRRCPFSLNLCSTGEPGPAACRGWCRSAKWSDFRSRDRRLYSPCSSGRSDVTAVLFLSLVASHCGSSRL